MLLSRLMDERLTRGSNDYSNRSEDEFFDQGTTVSFQHLAMKVAVGLLLLVLSVSSTDPPPEKKVRCMSTP